MILAYVKWKDALSVEGDNQPAQARLAELDSVGFFLHETEEAILIGMESEDEVAGRWRLNIPRKQILELRKTTLGKAFGKKSIVFPVPEVKPKPPDPM